jgi:hypothetical protein
MVDKLITTASILPLSISAPIIGTAIVGNLMSQGYNRTQGENNNRLNDINQLSNRLNNLGNTTVQIPDRNGRSITNS